MGTFVGRIQILRDNVGGGTLKGHLEVNQRYAAAQHWHPEWRHPDGGSAYYLRDPFFARITRYMEHLADSLLDEEGKGFSSSMMDNMENLSDAVYEHAPWEFADLRASGHPSVTHNGDTIHDRPPRQPRLTESELKAKHRLSDLFDPERYK
jgi:hypothetical protein